MTEPSLPLSYLACVSWPRSGHHLLVRLLREATGNSLNYCQYYNKVAAVNCCNHFPCRNPSINLSKQHDFKLDAPIDPEVWHLVQYRNFIPAVLSNYELFISGDVETRNTPIGFRQFALGQSVRYRGFIDKWVRSDIPKRTLVKYEDLAENPTPTIMYILNKLYSIHVSEEYVSDIASKLEHQSINAGKLKIDSRKGVFDNREIENFRFYNQKLFDLLVERAGDAGPRQE